MPETVFTSSPHKVQVRSFVMKPKVVVMPALNKRCVRIQIGSRVYELRVSVEISPVSLPARTSLIAMPNQLSPTLREF